MPIVGILRQHPDNSYLVIAHSREDGTLKKVDFYHESDARAMTFKRSFEDVSIIEVGKALKVDEEYLFTGEEPFLFFEISEARYQKIFEMAIKKAQKFAKEDKRYSVKHGLNYNMEQAFKGQLLFYEKDEAEDVARKVGYDGRPVNAKPRMVFGLVGLQTGEYSDKTWSIPEPDLKKHKKK